jgi:hypothetical protein
MRKLILLLSLLAITNSCFAVFSPNLPQQIVCDENSFCISSDSKYDIQGWSFSVAYGYLKPGIYRFNRTSLMGNPNDNFEKQVQFDYVMIDKDGYQYIASYNTINWLMPMHKENYKASGYWAYCNMPNVSDCYVNLVAPQIPKN